MTPQNTKDIINKIAMAKLYTLVDKIENILFDITLNETIETVRNKINWDYIPEGLFYTVANMVAGNYLMAITAKEDTAGTAGINAGGSVTSIREGDVSINFEAGSAACELIRIRELATSMLQQANASLLRYRRLTWL